MMRWSENGGIYGPEVLEHVKPFYYDFARDKTDIYEIERMSNRVFHEAGYADNLTKEFFQKERRAGVQNTDDMELSERVGFDPNEDYETLDCQTDKVSPKTMATFHLMMEEIYPKLNKAELLILYSRLDKQGFLRHLPESIIGPEQRQHRVFDGRLAAEGREVEDWEPRCPVLGQFLRAQRVYMEKTGRAPENNQKAVLLQGGLLSRRYYDLAQESLNQKLSQEL